jgi:uncharacterized membrane protein
MKTQLDPDRNIRNTDNYKWGVFYYNPDDSRVIVPKRYRSMGWTFNFAHPVSYLILVGIIAFAVFIGYLL